MWEPNDEVSAGEKFIPRVCELALFNYLIRVTINEQSPTYIFILLLFIIKLLNEIYSCGESKLSVNNWLHVMHNILNRYACNSCIFMHFLKDKQRHSVLLVTQNSHVKFAEKFCYSCFNPLFLVFNAKHVCDFLMFG